MGLKRGLCAMMLLALCIMSVQGTAPTFVNDPCADEIITQPDEGMNDATVYWAIPLAKVGDTPAAVTCDRMPGEKYAGGNNDVTCTAKDVDTPADMTTCTFQVRVFPTFERACPADFPSATGDGVTFDEPLTNVDTDGTTKPTVTCDNPVTFPAGPTTVTCEATGTESRKVSCSFEVTIGTLPTFTDQGSCADSKIDTAPDAGENTATVTWTEPTASAGASITCDHSTPAVFKGGDTTVTCEAADNTESRLFISCSFDVKVYPTFETGCPDNMVVANGASPTFTTPAVNADSTGAAVTASCSPPSGGPGFTDDLANDVTCTAQDGTLTSQKATCTFKVTLGTTPVFTAEGSCAAPGTIDVLPDTGKMTATGITWVTPTAGVDVNCIPDPDTATFVGGETDVTCTIADASTPTLINTCTFKVRVFPQFAENSCGEDVIRSPDPNDYKATYAWINSAIKMDGAAATVACQQASGSKFGGGENDVTCTATQAANEVSTCKFKVTVWPKLDGAVADMTQAPDAGSNKVASVTWTPPSVTDPGGATVTVTCTPELGTSFVGGSTPVECYGEDPTSKLRAVNQFSVNIWPNMPDSQLVLDIKRAPDLGKNVATNVVWDTPTATDSDGDPLTATCTKASGSDFSGGAHDVECVATDPLGATFKATSQFKVEVWPNMPDSELVQDINRAPDQGKNVATNVEWVAPAVTGSNGDPVPVTCTPASGLEFIGGAHDVSCVATDPLGAPYKATNQFKVKVFPTFATVCVDFPPVAPETGTTTVVEYVKPIGAPDSTTTNAVVTCVPETGTAFLNDKETVVTCFAVDSDTEKFPTKATCSLKVTVGTAPTFVANKGCLAEKMTGPTAGKNVAEGVTWTTPEATQSDGEAATVTCEPPSGSDFNGGSTPVTCTAVDTRMPNLKTECSFNVYVFPTFDGTCDDQFATPTSGNTNVNYNVPVGALDSTNTRAAVTCNPASGSSFPDNVATEVKCEATDSDTSYEEKATCSFNVLVSAAPTFDNDPACPADEAVSPGATGFNKAVATWTDPPARQGDGTATALVTCDPPRGSTFGAGDTTVTCTAEDPRSSSLTTTCDFKVRVYPTFASGCEDIEVDKGATGTETTVDYVPPVGGTDSLGTNLVGISCDPNTGDAFPNDQATEVTCNATDVAPDTFPDATCTFKVKVGTAPTFNKGCPSNIVVAPDASGEAVVTWEKVTGGSPATVQCDHKSGDTFNETETLVICTATDAGSERTSQCTFKVILDSVAPVILCPPTPANADAVTGTNKAPVEWTDPTVGYDDGDQTRPVNVTCIPKSGSSFVYGKTAVYCSAIDFVGNVGECSFDVTVTGKACDPVCAGESDCMLDDVGAASCVCRDGYSSATNDGADCANVDECAAATSPCHENADCTDLTPSFTCACKEDFYGDGIFSCSPYQDEYPDIAVPVDKVFQVELSIADASGADCDPVTDKESDACVALVNTFKLFVTPSYSGLSNSFKEVVVDQSQIRKGSVIVPHTVSYDYGTATTEIRALQPQQFFADTVKKQVEAGRIGSLEMVPDFESVKDTTNFCTEEIKNAMQCNNKLSVYEDKTDDGCQLKCSSRCSTDAVYCNGGTCTHDNAAGEICSSCPDGKEGALCEEDSINIPLIVGLSVGLGGGGLLIIIGLIVYFMCCRNKEGKATVTAAGDEEGGHSNNALALDDR
ncbi:hyalin-like [Patiria miniata]|uniref:Uncharacterized protein n=1 Tax=Patiria miniata TaxID=46514 RepID=A0A914B7E4_PATMI|nr:hyalin-like [Patiria miniata]